MVVKRDGLFLPSKLQAELWTAGVDVQGVTCTGSDGVVSQVQIVCADGTDVSVLDSVCVSHDPSPVPETPDPVAAAIVAALQVALPDLSVEVVQQAGAAASSSLASPAISVR